jgi:iron(III) transport system permease protein
MGGSSHRLLRVLALCRHRSRHRMGGSSGHLLRVLALRHHQWRHCMGGSGHRLLRVLALRHRQWRHRMGGSSGHLLRVLVLRIINRVTAWAGRAVASFAFWCSAIINRVTAWAGRAVASFAFWRSAIINRVTAWAGRAVASFAFWRSAIINRVTAWAGRAITSFAFWRSVIVDRITAWVGRAAVSFASWQSVVIDRVTAWGRRAAISFAFWRSVIVDRLTAWATRAAISFASYRYVIMGVTAFAVLAPLSLVLYQSFLTVPFFASSARVGLNAYQFVFADEDFAIAFGTTLLLGASMTLIAVPLGAMLAFLMVRTDIPGRLWLEPLILLLILLPPVVLAFGYVAALGPAGILTRTFEQWAGVVPWNPYSFPFLVAIAGLTHVPHVYLCVAAALRNLSSDAEEAARSAGANPWRVALDVSLPMATPAILFAGVLVFLLGFELFGLPLVLGDPQGLLVLSTYLYKLSNKLPVSPYQLMAVVAVIIAAVAMPLVFMLRLLLGEAQRHVAVRTNGLRSALLKLGPWRWTAFLAIVLWLTVTVLVPVAAITLRSFVESRVEGIALPEVLTLDHYRALLGHADATRSMINTLGIGLAGGAAAVVVYTAIALAIHRWRSDWARAVEYLVMLPRAMPGLVTGLALLWVFLLFKPLSSLRQTLISVWLAYTLVWLAYGVQLVSGIFRQVDPQLEDVARTVGATNARVSLDVTLPLVRNGILAGWVLIFLIFVREYSTGVYLLAPGTEVIGSLLVSLWGKGAMDLVSALSVVNVGMIGAGLLIANRLGLRLHG